MSEIRVSFLEKALGNLIKAYHRFIEDSSDDVIRAGCIQYFECSYELSFNLIKRYLKEEFSVNNIEEMPHNDKLREAAKAGLICDIQLWFEFRDARIKTSHAYNENKANECIAIIASFINEINYFLNKTQSMKKNA